MLDFIMCEDGAIVSIWRVLEISKTKDENQIRDAYRKKLVKANPEEDQKGFMELRKAYEEALEYAKKIDDDEEDNKSAAWPDTSMGRFMEKVDALYSDINLRGNKDEWKALLEDEICFSLETKTEARNEILGYFMTHDFLPHAIWEIIDDKFLLSEYKEELYEVFPVNYIDYAVMNGINYEEFIKIDKLKSFGGTDYDAYIAGCYKLFQLFRENKLDELEVQFKELEELKLYHPFSDIVRVNYYAEKQMIDEAYNLSLQLVKEYPKELEMNRVYSNVLMYQKRYLEAQQVYKFMLEEYPQNYNTLISMGTVCFELGEFEDAKEFYNEAYRINKTEYLSHCLQDCTQELIGVYEQKCKEDPENPKLQIERIRTYYQNCEFEKSLSLLKELNPTKEIELEHAHLTGCNYMYLENYEQALVYLLKWSRGTEILEDDGTKERKKAMDRLSASYQCIAQTLSGLKRFEEAHEYIQKAIETGIEVTDAYEEDARIYLREKKYETAIDVCDRIPEEDRSFITHSIKAEALYELDYIIDSKLEWDKYLELSPYNLGAYFRKLSCLRRLNEKKEAFEILHYLESQGVKSDSLEMWNAIFIGEDGRPGEAKSILSKLIAKAEKHPKEFEKSILDQLYYEMARIYFCIKIDKQKSLKYLNKSLEVNPNYVFSINLKAHYYYEEYMYDEALVWFKKVIEEKPNHFNANSLIGDIYNDMGEYDKALSYYTKQIKINPDAFEYIHRGLLYADLDEFKKARSDYEKGREMNPDDQNAYNNIGVTFQYEGNYKLALEYFEKAIERIDSDPKRNPYINMATVYLRLREYDKAIEVYKTCIKKLNNNEYENLARAYMMSGRYEEAIEQFEIYKSISKEDFNKYKEDIANCYLFIGKKIKGQLLINLSWGSIENEQKRSKACLSYYLSDNKMLGAKTELNNLINYYLVNNIGQGNYLLIRYIAISLRTSKGRYNPYKNRRIAQVISKFEDKVKRMDEKPGNMAYKNCQLAILEIGHCNYNKAIGYIEKALSCRQCNSCDFCACAEAFFIKAQIMEIIGDYKEALLCYEKAYKTDMSDILHYIEYERMKKKRLNKR